MIRAAQHLLASMVVIASIAACRGSDARDTNDTGPPPIADMEPRPVAGTGPRPIGGATVELELDAFARPADEACADPTAVIDVPAGGSITDAVEEARPGTLVRLAPGTYAEGSTGSEALRLDGDAVCIRALDGPAVLEAANGQATGITVTADDVVIDGLVVRGFEIGIAIGGRPGATQRGVTIERTTIEAAVGEFRDGIVVLGEPSGDEVVLDGLLVMDTTVTDVDLGISCNVGPCEHVWLERATVAGRAVVEGSGADAMAIEEGRQIVVVDSVVGGVTADGIDTKADDVVVAGSRVLDVGRNGIKLWRGGDVINTIIDGTGADASLVGEEPARYRYVHVLVTHHGEPGQSSYVATWGYDLAAPGMRIEIVNSIFSENTAGGLFVPSGAELLVEHTIFDGAPADRLVAVGDAEEYTLGELAAFEQAGYGAGNLVADPGFVDPDGQDFATAPGSAARDAGVVVAGLDVDALGGPRQRGPAPDVGPVES